ncbi:MULTISPECIES: hypothetical protein [unclassified Rhizobium]|uniref:hypothetical protein n=1 Tax=unclassified Rhizobium TaxID=2613769 RepID=UPI001B32BCCC|nr:MULTISPECIES: hypothetical protein [unclassified Rhizobium]MBX5256881.1 hypothetical protein [Rhizobium sp. NLR16b]MBX5262973.1 hypothetical protein [Rhizobium sp. NLR16a]MBX5311538.1 hypothetical protein [Rhizobium sp. NLR11b]QTU95936.1 hypothetical protein J7U39_16025 [Rhizobium sp. NLR16a]
MAGYYRGSEELRQKVIDTLEKHGGAMQNYELARIALEEKWPIHNEKMWGTHGLLNTLREDGRVVKVARGRYALSGNQEATNGGWSVARKRILATTKNTVANSGKTVSRRLKTKQLNAIDLLRTLDDLAERQAYRCARTGVKFDEAVPDLRASLDRIDSAGHYDDGSMIGRRSNLQLVTHWYNMAKGTRSDSAMLSLLRLHATAFR